MSAMLGNTVPSVAMPLNRSINTGPDSQRLVAVDTRLPSPNLKAATDMCLFDQIAESTVTIAALFPDR